MLNLFSGSIAIVFAFMGNLALSAWFIGLAAVFDLLDGMLARWLDAGSAIGKELDSLADVISFGLAPGMILFHLMLNSFDPPFIYWKELNLAAVPAFLVPAFAALRLAMFNVDTRQNDYFIGLPTPANALFLASLPLVILQARDTGWEPISILLNNYWFLLITGVAMALLMVSPIRLFSLKFKSYSFRQNLLRYNFLIISLALFLLIRFVALPLTVILYMIFSVLFFRPEKQP